MNRRKSRQKQKPKRRLKSLGRILAAVASGALVGVSLVVFPGGVLVMIAVWLAIHTVLIARGKPGWLPLALCVAILVGKQVAFLPGMTFLAVTLGVVSALRLIGQFRSRGLSGPVHKAALALVWVAWMIAALDSHRACRTSHQGELDRQRPVVCLGDSLTAYGYPQDLVEFLSVPVINMGRDGFSTTDALGLLPEIRAADPQAVIVELGGHDYLREHGQETCRQNLETIIEECRAMGAEVILVEIPRGIARDPFRGIERHLAMEYDLELVSDSTLRWFVLLGPYAPPGMWLPANRHLSDDGLHPNERGNRLFAATVRDALVRVFGEEIASGQP